MITLFEWPPTRSQRAKWVLEELGLDYESRLVDMPKGEQNSAEYRAVHPLGMVPALETGDYRMFESVAIVLQLIDEHPDRKLAPPPGSPQRAAYYQWCIFAGTEVDPAIMLYFDNKLRPLEHLRPPATRHDPKFAERGRHDFVQRAKVLTQALETKDYLIADSFSGADILIGHSCFMAKVTGLIDDFPVLQRYYENLCQRPAHQRAYGDFA